MKSSALVFFTFITALFSSFSALADGLSEAKLTALIAGDLKQANKTISNAIEENPSDAQLHKVAGDVYAVRAQGASIFSAPGLAKKTLKAYKKAVALEPNNTQYRMSLMQFYLFAPAIVGGSKKLAGKQAIQIKELDPVSSVVADSLLLLKEKDEKGLETLFTELTPALSNNPSVKMAKANYLRSTENYKQAATLLAELTELTASDLTEEQRLLPYQAMLQMGFLAMKSNAHQSAGLASFKRYLKSAPDTYKLTSKKWVSLFLGKLYAIAGKPEMAKSTLVSAKQAATDQNLIDEIDNTLDGLK